LVTGWVGAGQIGNRIAAVVDVDSLARLALFADLAVPDLESIAHAVDEQRYDRGTKVLRAGLSGNSFYVILDGEAVVLVDGVERARLRAGDFLGEISILTGVPVIADVVAESEELRCAVLPGPELKPLLLRHPQVAIRMLELGARRLRATTLWEG
jgi:CRP-like cAMP-binding protein